MRSQAVEDDRKPDIDEIRSRPCPKCFLCGTSGEPLYQGLTDRLFDAPGEWNLERCPNSECGLIWLDPMPLEEDIGRAYANYFTHAAPGPAPEPQRPASIPRRAANLFRSAYLAHRFNYGEGAGKRFRWLLALPILLSRIECDGLDIPLRYLAVPQKGRMLDVGCGDGSMLKLAEELGWDAEGVDFDADAVANARRKSLTVRAGALADQKYRDDSFDLVLMSHVIEHVPDPLGTMREIRRVLRPGAVLAVTTPNAASMGHGRFGRDWRGLEPPRHLNIFTGAAMRELARTADFSHTIVVSTLRITGYCFVQSRLTRRSGYGEHGQAIPLRDRLAGRWAAVSQMLARASNPLCADELLLVASK
jgi:SAM-dependent methyltransferase